MMVISVLKSVSNFPVNFGDVVGACIYDPQDGSNRVRKQLDIVGQANDHSLMQMNDIPYSRKYWW